MRRADTRFRKIKAVLGIQIHTQTIIPFPAGVVACFENLSVDTMSHRSFADTPPEGLVAYSCVTAFTVALAKGLVS